MPTLLIVEDGTGIAGANTYATVAEARAYATARALTLPVSDTAVENALILACDKLESYRYKGKKTDEDNRLEWPRKDVFVGSAITALDDDFIPDRLKLAQCQLAYDSTLTDLQPTGSGREVVREKVDVLEVEYAKEGSGSITPQFNKAESYLAPLLQSGGSFALNSIRV